MKTYAIVGNQYEGVYTKPWSQVQKFTQTKPAPKYKGFTSQAAAEKWFAEQTGAGTNQAHHYETIYNGHIQPLRDHYYLFTDGGSRNTGNHRGSHVQASDLAAWAIALFKGTDMQTPTYTAKKAYHGRTNNDMELAALIMALNVAQDLSQPVTIVSDSKYVLDTVTDWMYSWQANGWQKASGPIANLAGWQTVFELMQSLQEKVSFIWVKGHATSRGNQLVDQLLNQAMDNLD
ncbi:ribonuclease H family protein [Weissella halotolerans]|uniref:ribonuclease H n=1 Tax=Weissella halotolerans DSM 20190 TaxID=1123500 RepID=A0A0R2G5X2_9LACO|nr:ribonuclease H [Weissella halotolerans]KRN32173.1 RNase HI [Weissella halotolerans DSM 20190]